MKLVNIDDMLRYSHNLPSIFNVDSILESSKFFNLDSIFESILLKKQIKNLYWTHEFQNDSRIQTSEKFWIVDEWNLKRTKDETESEKKEFWIEIFSQLIIWHLEWVLGQVFGTSDRSDINISEDCCLSFTFHSSPFCVFRQNEHE